MQLSVAQWRPGGYVGGGRPCWGRALVIGGFTVRVCYRTGFGVRWRRDLSATAVTEMATSSVPRVSGAGHGGGQCPGLGLHTGDFYVQDPGSGDKQD